MSKRLIRSASNKIDKLIRLKTNQESLYSRGLAREGYLGGYSDALQDVLLVLNKIKPNRSIDLDIWEDEKKTYYIE